MPCGPIAATTVAPPKVATICPTRFCGSTAAWWRPTGPCNGSPTFSARRSTVPPFSPSEVRLLSAVNGGVAFVLKILMKVFRTGGFRHNIRSRHIGQGGGPRRREDALVLDRHVQLQELAPVVAEDIAVEQPILFFVPLDGVLHVVVFTQPIAFDDMQ